MTKGKQKPGPQEERLIIEGDPDAALNRLLGNQPAPGVVEAGAPCPKCGNLGHAQHTRDEWMAMIGGNATFYCVLCDYAFPVRLTDDVADNLKRRLG